MTHYTVAILYPNEWVKDRSRQVEADNATTYLFEGYLTRQQVY